MAPHCTAVASVPSGQRSKPRAFHSPYHPKEICKPFDENLYIYIYQFVYYMNVLMSIYVDLPKKPEELWPHQLLHSMPRWSAWMFIIPTGNLCEKTEKFIPPAVCETFFLVPTASPICMGSIQVSSDIYICIYLNTYIIYIYNNNICDICFLSSIPST